MVNLISEIDPTACPKEAEKLAEIWEEVVGLIVEEMLAHSTPRMESLHITLREEMILELAKLTYFLKTRVVNNRMKGRTVHDIDPKAERAQCFSPEGIERISEAGQNCANGIWLRKYTERWKLKTEAALKKEEKKEQNPTDLVPKRVTKNHFISNFLIKKYWAEGQFIYKTVKRPDGLSKKIKTSVGNWGYRPNLYSDQLEAYFGLLEGDAARPIQMLLNVEPLNRPQREALVAFIVIHQLRNPYFIGKLENSMFPLVSTEDSPDRSADARHMRILYEMLYRDNDFYDRLARPIIHSRWVMVRADSPDFVLPDVCNLLGKHEDRQYVVMPLTPSDCLIVLPVRIDRPRIVPHSVNACESLTKDLSHLLSCAATKEFLSKSQATLTSSLEDPRKVAQRVFSSLTKLTNET